MWSKKSKWVKITLMSVDIYVQPMACVQWQISPSDYRIVIGVPIGWNGVEDTLCQYTFKNETEAKNALERLVGLK